MRVKGTYIVAIILLALSVLLAYNAFTSYINPYLSVSQVTENSALYLNKNVQILGNVANGTIQSGSPLRFNLTDDKSSLRVSHYGPMPQNFNEGQQIVVIGRLVSTDMVEASQILVKCPSKYEGENVSIFADPVFLVAILLGVGAFAYFIISTVLKKQKNKY